MSLVFSSLSTYTKQLVKPLLTSAVLDATTQQLIMDGGTVIPGVKGSISLPIMDTDAAFQADGCGWTASGTTTFSQRTLVPGKIKLEEAICTKSLEQYYTAEALRAGSTYEDFGNAEFQAAYLAKKNARIAAQLETALWQGDITGSTVNLTQFDGLSKILRLAGTSVNANVSGYTGVSGSPITTVSATNVVAATEGIFKAIPVEVLKKGDVKIFVGTDWYRLLILAYRALNLFSYNPQDSAAKSFILPGTDVEIVAVNGLNGTGDAYAISLSNLYLGVDLESEDQNYTLFYNQLDNEVRFRASWKIGIQVGFPSECVSFVAAI